MNDKLVTVQLNGKIWKAFDRLTEISSKFSAFILLAVVSSVLYQIIARLSHIPTRGIVELGDYLLVWICYFALPYGLRDGRHIRVDILYGRMPKKIQDIFLIIGNVICIIFSLIITWEGIKLIRMFYEIGERSLSLNIPMYIVYIGMPLGMFLFAIEAIREIVIVGKKWEKPIIVSLEQEVEHEVEGLIGKKS